MFTLGNYGFLGVMIVVALIIAVLVACEAGARGAAISGIICAVLIILTMIGIGWYNTHTASGIRAIKDFKSEIANGIDREIIITAEDGREIFRYEGKIDIESNHTDNYIKFESEDGKRYIIYYGIQDTITIIEK